jgi:hypothetical protein
MTILATFFSSYVSGRLARNITASSIASINAIEALDSDSVQ